MVETGELKNAPIVKNVDMWILQIDIYASKRKDIYLKKNWFQGENKVYIFLFGVDNGTNQNKHFKKKRYSIGFQINLNWKSAELIQNLFSEFCTNAHVY